MLKNNIKKINNTKKQIKEAVKQENGAVALLVIVTVLFIVILLAGIYFSSTSNTKAQLQSDLKIIRQYKEDVDNINTIYNQLIM